MTSQIIYTYPNKYLFKKAIEIPKKDIKSDTFSQIGASMLEILRKKGGIGLSANQVGLPFRMCVIELTKYATYIMLNPRVTHLSKLMQKSTEGCLSLPGCVVVVNRHKNVKLEYEDVMGETQSLNATGLFSNCIQHEIDHLNGILTINRLSKFHADKALKDISRWKRKR